MTQLISKMGARRVITMDLFDNRLAVSKLMGATHSVNTSRVDPVAAVKEITNEMMCDIGAPYYPLKATECTRVCFCRQVELQVCCH